MGELDDLRISDGIFKALHGICLDDGLANPHAYGYSYHDNDVRFSVLSSLTRGIHHLRSFSAQFFWTSCIGICYTSRLRRHVGLSFGSILVGKALESSP